MRCRCEPWDLAECGVVSVGLGTRDRTVPTSMIGTIRPKMHAASIDNCCQARVMPDV